MPGRPEEDAMLRLRQVALVAEQLAPVVDDLRAVLGLEVGFVDPGVGTFGLENSILPVGTQFVEVVAPVKEGTAGGRYLERRGGDGGYMVITQAEDHAARRARVAELGIRTVLEFEEGEHYRCMQLHPADTGGTFLEIDWNEGWETPGGDWDPAGKEWRAAIRTDVVDAITAVEVQAGDPRRLAERWAEIVEIDLVDRDGTLVLPLENAEVRFVEATDGRGDGLSGIELRATDVEKARQAAAERGVVADDGTVTICGMRVSFSGDE
jgi:hypothetical protein